MSPITKRPCERFLDAAHSRRDILLARDEKLGAADPRDERAAPQRLARCFADTFRRGAQQRVASLAAVGGVNRLESRKAYQRDMDGAVLEPAPDPAPCARRIVHAGQRVAHHGARVRRRTERLDQRMEPPGARIELKMLDHPADTHEIVRERRARRALVEPFQRRVRSCRWLRSSRPSSARSRGDLADAEQSGERRRDLQRLERRIEAPAQRLGWPQRARMPPADALGVACGKAQRLDQFGPSRSGLTAECVAPASRNSPSRRESPCETSTSNAAPTASTSPGRAPGVASSPSAPAPRASITATEAPLARKRASAPSERRAATTRHPALAASAGKLVALTE